MVEQFEISLRSRRRGFHLISDEVIAALPALPEAGLLNIFIQHSSAGITLNENADDSVRDDFETVFNKLVPENDPDYRHTLEGADDMPAHIKTSLVGASVSIPITRGRLNMGIWQGIYLCEFRNNGGSRRLVLTLYY
ncbi:MULTISPECIES: secondary thiamine-phosphate synthase enzyme YjbQ [unclassified Carboxylicivirga]|uniref:secondary thiamine-phosphate synthase enzyme YjbQ n=1 Tax=Carboxylicivirga TaxID=1628153 RepID=UPI003D3553BF